MFLADDSITPFHMAIQLIVKSAGLSKNNQFLGLILFDTCKECTNKLKKKENQLSLNVVQTQAVSV